MPLSGETSSKLNALFRDFLFLPAMKELSSGLPPPQTYAQIKEFHRIVCMVLEDFSAISRELCEFDKLATAPLLDSSNNSRLKRQLFQLIAQAISVTEGGGYQVQNEKLSASLFQWWNALNEMQLHRRLAEKSLFAVSH